MGLYLKLNRDNDLSEIFELYDNLLKDLKDSFNFALSEKDIFQLIEDGHHKRAIWKYKIFDKDMILNLIKEDIKDMIGKKSYTLMGEGVIYLKKDNELDGMVIDINAFYLNNDSELYGDVYINFYDSSQKWEDYFFRDDPDCIDNFNSIGFIGNSLKEKFNLKYAFIGTYENFQKEVLSKGVKKQY